MCLGVDAQHLRPIVNAVPQKPYCQSPVYSMFLQRTMYHTRERSKQNMTIVLLLGLKQVLSSKLTA